MKFLYNFIGRGLFNIYVGVMPLSLVRLNDKDQDKNFQIIIFIMIINQFILLNRMQYKHIMILHIKK